MSVDKAKELFSAYYEGTLEKGLAQTLERQLTDHPLLKEEYVAFEETMQQLESLKFEEAPLPFDLHETISARLDRHLYEEKQKRPAPLGLWLRNLAFGGVAAAALLGAVLSLRAPEGKTNRASLATNSNQLALQATPTGAVIVNLPKKDGAMVIRAGVHGQLIRRIELKSVGADGVPLHNSNPEPSLVTIDVPGSEPFLVALPGAKRLSEREGQGSLTDFAQALAGFYNVPVKLEVQDTKIALTWSFQSSDPADAAAISLTGTTFSVDERRTGILCILDH